MLYILAQMIGGLAVVLSLAMYQVNDRKMVLRIAAAAACLYGLAFFYLHAYTGAALNLFAASRCYMFSRVSTRKSSAKTFVFFVILSAMLTVITWAGPISLLPFAGTVCYAASEGQLRTKRLRTVALFAPPLWFIYNFLTGFYPGMFVEIFVLISNGVGQYRFDRKVQTTSR